MTRNSFFALVLGSTITLCLPMLAADWTHHPAPYAKSLAEDIVKSQPDLLDAIFHVTPPGSADNYAVAAHTPSEQGSKSGEDDMSVMTTGKPLVEVQKDGKRIGVVLPLHDKTQHTIGAIGLMYEYLPGQDQNIFLKRSETIRDGLAKKIGSKESLFKDR